MPSGGQLEGRWRGWNDKRRWRWDPTHGRWWYRSCGTGPDGGSDCPQAHPARSARNKKRKEQKHRASEARGAQAIEDPSVSWCWWRHYQQYTSDESRKERGDWGENEGDQV